MINKENIDDLLAKYLADEANTHETAAVDEWINESDNNQTIFNQSQQVWERVADLRPQQVVDVEAAWLKMGIGQALPIIPAEKSTAPIMPLPTFRANALVKNFIRIAAALVILVGLGYLGIKQFGTTQEVAMVVFKSGSIATEKVLSDGTKVFLNKNSSITFPPKFLGDNRTITLTGEAFFDVHHDAAHPFIIHAEGSDIKVLGTSFNVKAYNPQVQVVVTTGKVQFSKNEHKVVLTKGQKAELSANTSTIIKSVNDDFEVLSYKTASFTFDRTSIAEVAQLLSENFKVTIDFDKDNLKNCQLTAKFNHENLENILTVIAETLNLTVEKHENTIILRGEGCQ